ncbi:hypothetical protein J9B05_31195, partial [Klebsiella pneumoniae]
ILPSINGRKKKILAFNDNGNPIAVLPESGSAADVLINLGSSEGSTLVGHKGITLSEYLDLTKALPHVSPLWQKVRSA